MNPENLTVKIAKGTSLLFMGSLAGYFISFFYKIILARGLGPEEYGVFSLVLMMVGFFTTFFSLGLPSAITKYTSEYISQKKEIHTIFSTAAPITVFTATLGSVLLFFLSGFFAINVFHNPLAVIPFKIGSLAVFFSLFSGLFSGVLTGFQKMGILSFSGVIEKGSKFLLTILFFSLGFKILGATWAYSLSFFVMFVFLVVAYKHTTPIIFKKAEFNLAKKLLSFGVPLFMAGIAATFLGWTDSFFIGYFLTAKDVGYYNVALPVVGLLSMVMAALAVALFPMISQLNAKKDKKSLGEIFNRSLKYSIYFILPAATGSFLLAKPIIQILFTSEYLAAVPAFRILSIGTIFTSLIVISRSFIAGINEPRKIMKYTFIAAILNVILNYFLIPLWGINGAAIATVTSLILLFLLSIKFIRKKIKLNLSYIFKPIISSAIMAFSTILILQTSLPKIMKMVVIIFLAIVLYFSVMYLLKGFDKKDKEMIRKFTPVRK